MSTLKVHVKFYARTDSYIIMLTAFWFLASLLAALSSAASVPKGFVSTHGGNFVLDGKPFVRKFHYFLGLPRACLM